MIRHHQFGRRVASAALIALHPVAFNAKAWPSGCSWDKPRLLCVTRLAEVAVKLGSCDNTDSALTQ
jgi:hypothetical protein